MKILYISKAHIPSKISNSLSIMKMCQAFNDEEHEVLLTGIKPSQDSQNPIEYYGLKGGFKVINIYLNKLFENNTIRKLQLSSFYLAFKTRYLFKSFKPDIIYSRLTLFELILVPPSIPIIYEMHSLSYLGNSWIQRILFLWIVKKKRFNKIIVTSNTLKDLLKKYIPNIDIVVARLSAELPISISKNEMEAFKERNINGLNFKNHVGYTGYLDKVGLRGTDIICKTAALCPNIAFHIVGGDTSVVNYWREFSKEYNFNKNIFFYGYRKSSEIPYFLSLFDVVLAPLQFKPTTSAPTGAGMSPLKIAQYMSYGKAIVASRIPAHEEILVHKYNALLVKDNDHIKWSKSILKILENKDLASSFGKEAKNKYMLDLTPKKRVEKILNCKE